VRLLWCFTSGLLCWDQEIRERKSRCRKDESSARSLGKFSEDLWIPACHPLVGAKAGDCAQPQGCFAFDEQAGDPFQCQEAQNVQKLEESLLYHRAENVLNRDFNASKPNQKWVTDVTYIHTQQGWSYLSTIKDLYDGFIVAHTFGLSNSVQLVTDMLRQAKQKEKATDGLILHSDQGNQYTSQAYYDLLVTEYNITPSMSRRGNCWDNASMENFFGHLKEESLLHVKNPSFDVITNSLMITSTFSTTKGYN
jgi:putative transposase